MPDDTAEGVKDRLARRFEGDSGSSSGSAPSEGTERDTKGRGDDDESSRSGGGQDERGAVEQSRSNRTDRPSDGSKAMNATNVKEEWNAFSVYLPEELDDNLSRAYKKLDWELDEAEGLSIKKTRHFYPLVVDLGLERIERMESNEIKERMEDIEQYSN